MKKLLFPLLLLLPLCAAVAEPPKRIISLAPHLTEMLFEIGAGEQLVGTVSYSNYPEAATRIPVIGSYNRLDLEAILAQRPDLILGWESGNATAELERLRALGIPLHISEPRKLEDVATVMESLGTLIGQQYQQQRPLRVFYQVWNRPLITINGEQIISHVIELCGGINVFANLDSLSPQISVEAVLERDPQVIVASGMDASRPEWLDGGSHYPTLQAVQQGDLYHVPPDILQRHGPRLLQGAEQLCKALQKARE